MRKIADWCYDHNRTVVISWIVLFFVAAIGSGVVGSKYSEDFLLPGTDTQRAQDLLEAKFPQQSGDSSQLVFHVDKGKLTDKRAQVEAVVAEVRKQPTIVKGPRGVTDPLKGPISKDGRTALATITHTGLSGDLEIPDIQKVIDATETSGAAKSAKDAGIQVALGGQVVQTAEQNDSGVPIAELIGVVIAMFLLYFVLRSVTAVLIPIIAAVLSTTIAISFMVLVSNAFSIPSFTTFLIPLIGLGVGIDYGLLTLSRVRNELAKGFDMRTSVGSTLETAGRSVIFAGLTVMIALLGMLLLGINFLNGPAIGTSFAVFLTMATTLTLVPALLASRPFHKRLKVGTEVDPDTETHFWARFSRFAQRRPWALGVVGLVILLIAASPVLGMRLAFVDAGNNADDTSSRKAYDLIAKGFGPGFSGPFFVAAELGDSPNAQATLDKLRASYKTDPGVAAVGKASINDKGDTAVIQVTPKAKPQDQATVDTLNRLRDKSSAALAGTGVKAYIGGAAAASVDFSAVISDKLPLFIGVVVGLSLILLMIVFRSIAIPIKAGLMNLLSIGVALGVVTWVFQDGHLLSLIGVDQPGPIAPFLPVLLFAIVFGLSMDYEVFLVSRMHEEWVHTKDAATSVRHGLALTGKVITVAGLVMMAVFGAFVLQADPIGKLFGLAFTAAIFFDAFVIRMLVVPAVMFILGKHAWWLPKWLDKILPRVSLEGPEDLAGPGSSKK
jgi:RND superfamily putative drug exporter